MTKAYEEVKKWRQADPERWRAITRDYNKRQAKTVSARRARYRQRHKEDIKAAKARKRLEIRLFIDEAKASTGCCFCGENFPAALDYHHVGDKEGTIAAFRINKWDMLVVAAEMAKCVVVCANCHRKVHAGVLSLDE